MSPLDDAWQLLNEMAPDHQGMCLFCYGVEDQPGPYGRTQHKPGCVYLRRGQIIAALEAAERLIFMCDIPGEAHVIYTDRPEWQALVAALNEEVVPPNTSVLTGSGP